MDGKLNCSMTAENAAFTKIRHLDSRVTDAETRLDILEQETTQLDEALQDALTGLQETVVTENVDTALLRADSIGTALLTTDDIIVKDMTATAIEAESIDVDNLENVNVLHGKTVDVEKTIATIGQFTETHTTTVNNGTTNTEELNVDGETNLTGQVNIDGNVTFTKDNGLSKLQGNYLEIDAANVVVQDTLAAKNLIVTETAVINNAQLSENSVLTNPTLADIKKTQEVSSTCIDLDEDGKLIRVNIGTSSEVVSTALKSVVDDVEKVNISAESAAFNVPVIVNDTANINTADIASLSADKATTNDITSETITINGKATTNDITSETITINGKATTNDITSETITINDTANINTADINTADVASLSADNATANDITSETITINDKATIEDIETSTIDAEVVKTIDAEIDGMKFYRGKWYDKIFSSAKPLVDYILDTTDKSPYETYNILFTGNVLDFRAADLPDTAITSSQVIGTYKVYSDSNDDVRELNFVENGYDPLDIGFNLFDNIHFYGFKTQLDVASKDNTRCIHLNNCTLYFKDNYGTNTSVGIFKVNKCNNVNITVAVSWNAFPRLEWENCNNVQLINWGFAQGIEYSVDVWMVNCDDCYVAVPYIYNGRVSFGQVGKGSNLVVFFKNADNGTKKEPTYTLGIQ